MKNKIIIIYFSLLIVFTIYILLDTFVISKSYEVVENYNKNKITYTNSNITDNSYIDDNIEIKINEYYEYNTKIYVADIKINSLDYLNTAFANNTYGKNIIDTTSNIAKLNNAILAINGDYYGVRNTGYVIRNGKIYRNIKNNNQEDLVIYSDGSLEIINENDITAEALLQNKAYQVFSFGPSLIENNNITVSTTTEVGKAMSSNPRTAIGLIEKNHYIFLVSDGRTNESKGLSLYQLANFMKSLNVKTAYNLDGGGSSTMYFMGKIINNPTTNGNKIKERSISDIVYIG